jgi:hypothetical protein
MITDTYIKLKKTEEINDWNHKKNDMSLKWNYQLEYIFILNYYFMFELKKREMYWSWILIIISTLASVLSIVDTEHEIVSVTAKYTLTFFSIITALIAAYIKRENYVERIKNIDRYVQKVGNVKTEISLVMQCKPWNRILYDNFIDKFKDTITSLFSYPPPISPLEFKNTVYKLTKFYPELIIDTYPWYIKDKIHETEFYKMTMWGQRVLESYYIHYYKNFYKKIIYCYICRMGCSKCCRHKESSVFIDPDKYNINQIDKMRQDKKYRIEREKKLMVDNLALIKQKKAYELEKKALLEAKTSRYQSEILCSQMCNMDDISISINNIDDIDDNDQNNIIETQDIVGILLNNTNVSQKDNTNVSQKDNTNVSQKDNTNVSQKDNQNER